MELSTEQSALKIKELEIRLEEYEQLIEAIKAGEVDAFALNKNNKSEVFTLQTGDYAYRMLVENFGEGALNITDETLIVYTNNYFLELLNLPYDGVIGKSFFEFVHPGSKETFNTLFKKGLAGQCKGEINLSVGNKIIPIYISLTSLYPTLPTVGIIVTDLSEKKKQLNILKENQEKFNALFQLSPFAVILAESSSGKIVDANENYLKTFGHTRDELIGKTSLEINLIDKNTREGILQSLLHQGAVKNLEVELRKKSGEKIPVLVSIETITLNGEKYFLNAITDIVDRKRAEEKIERQNRELLKANDELNRNKNFIHSVLKSTNHGVLSYLAIRKNNEVVDFTVTYANQMALEQLNLPAEKVIGSTYFTIIPHAKKDGLWQRVIRVLNTGKSEVHEVTAPRFPDRHYLVKYTPLEDGITCTFIEITEQKKQEEILREKNYELEKMNKELTSFAYIASHDLQEPLRKIQTFATRIAEKEGNSLSENGMNHFKRMQDAARRMQKLIEDLLAYSRINTAERKFETTNLNTIIEEVKEDLHEEIKEKHVTIEAAQICEVNIIPFQFRQLMHNIIGNALKFSNPDIAPYIKITGTNIPYSKLNMPKLAPRKEYCHIQITDNGIGFEQQYSEKIFEVFQRLHAKNEYNGTGIGLSIVKKIVENHNGIITATSKLNQGATFDIYIPAL